MRDERSPSQVWLKKIEINGGGKYSASGSDIYNQYADTVENHFGREGEAPQMCVPPTVADKWAMLEQVRNGNLSRKTKATCEAGLYYLSLCTAIQGGLKAQPSDTRLLGS